MFCPGIKDINSLYLKKKKRKKKPCVKSKPELGGGGVKPTWSVGSGSDISGKHLDAGLLVGLLWQTSGHLLAESPLYLQQLFATQAQRVEDVLPVSILVGKSEGHRSHHSCTLPTTILWLQKTHIAVGYKSTNHFVEPPGKPRKDTHLVKSPWFLSSVVPFSLVHMIPKQLALLCFDLLFFFFYIEAALHQTIIRNIIYGHFLLQRLTLCSHFLYLSISCLWFLPRNTHTHTHRIIFFIHTVHFNWWTWWHFH